MIRVSPLKVRVFGTCRLRYRYQYVDRIAAQLRPADTAGSLVHRILCDFFSKIAREERTGERLLRMFEEGWAALSRRYLRMPGTDRLRDSAIEQLQRFARQHDLQAEPFMVEPYFQVVLVPDITLFGRLDRIDAEPDASLHVIDYKTGAQPDEVDAGQLRLYAIMAEEKLRRPVSRASFWYLDDGQVWTMELGPEDKAQTRAELLAAVQEMQNVDEFPPTIGPHCRHCPYFRPCEFREEVLRRAEDEGW